jgi:hypothetical protein
MPGELQLVEKKINGGNPAVPGNDEISTSVFRGFTNDGHEFSFTLLEREIFSASDEKEEVAVLSAYRQTWSAWPYPA